MNETMTFAILREAFRARLPRFRNRKRERAHSQPDGSDWQLSTWCNAREAAGKECADVATYLDILASRLGVDLGQAVVDKFNEVSARVDAGVLITNDRHGDPQVVVLVDDR